ncbi:hypothetical protein Tco_0604690 [Tanacetum coccineum]
MTNNINHLKEIVDQAWVKHSNDRLHLRNPTAQDMEILIKTCLIPLALKTRNDSFAFVHELKQEMHADLKYIESLEDKIDELEFDKAEFSNMYDTLLQECVSNDIMCSYLQSSFDLDEITGLQCLYLHKKLIEKCKGKSMDTNFDKPSIVRQLNAQRIPKPSVLGKPAHFSDSLERKYFAKKKSVLKTNESEGLSKPVTPQNLPQTATQAVRNTNVIKPGMYRIASSTTQTRAPQLNQTSRNTNPRVSTSTGVAHKTNVSRPQPRSNQMKDKVVPNTSHVKFKKTEVEEHPRISSISNQTKSVTACNDSLNSRTSNVNAVCATCGKCVFNSNHDACVSKFLNDVNARTKKPNVVPISTRKPKSQANKSVATPHKKTVASESTITNSKSYYRMLYKKTNKAWKWWIAQQCPSAYTWVPKTKRKWVPKVRNESVTKKIVQLILFIVDSGCTKHMTGNLSLLCNFVEKYLGTVRFGNDQFAPILGYGDLVQGNITIKRVYYVEASDEELEAPMEDQPLPADASPTALSAGYIADFNSEEDEEDPADHPADGGDNDDNESSNDDDDDDDDTLHYVRSLSVMNFLGMKLHIHFVSCDLQEMMTTVNQGMSVEEIERVVAQRVVNAIKAIAIYETKTNIALKSMIQTE